LVGNNNLFAWPASVGNNNFFAWPASVGKAIAFLHFSLQPWRRCGLLASWTTLVTFFQMTQVSSRATKSCRMCHRQHSGRRHHHRRHQERIRRGSPPQMVEDPGTVTVDDRALVVAREEE
jgi:hypothetical protein